MKSIKMKFFNQVHPKLEPYVKHYWKTSGVLENHNAFQILPMDHVDLVIPVKGSIHYLLGEEEYFMDDIIFHGLRRHSIEVYQDRFLEAYGITFTPAGFYGVIKQPLELYTNRIVKLKEENESLYSKLSAIDYAQLGEIKIIKAIESSLLSQITENDKYNESREIINVFLASGESTVKDYCEDKSIQRKTFERLFKKYVGLPPKDYISIRQFEEASREVLYEEERRLTDVAYDVSYADQSHFSKRFKNYTTFSPSQFKKSHKALKSKITFKK